MTSTFVSLAKDVLRIAQVSIDPGTRMYVRFTRPASLTFTIPDGSEVEETNDLDREFFYLLVAYGNVNEQGEPSFHEDKDSSSEIINFAEG